MVQEMNPRILLVTTSLALSVLIGTVIARRGGTPEDGTRRARPRPVIGLSLDTLKEERWQRDRDRFVAAANRLGADVEVSEANSDDKVQAQGMNAFIGKRVDAIVIVPHDAKAMAQSVQAARDAGIPVLSYDRLVADSDVSLYLSFENEKVGEQQAKYLLDHLSEGKGRIIRLYGSKSDNNAHLFKKGQDRILQPAIDRGDVKVIFEDWVQDWKPENAKKIMNAAISSQGKEFEGVLVSNDGTAGGVVQAMIEEGIAGKAVVTGQDADLAACQRIMRGTQSMTIYKPLQVLAESAAAAAVKLARREVIVATASVNNGTHDVPAILSETIAVDKSNMLSTVVKDGFQPAEQLK